MRSLRQGPSRQIISRCAQSEAGYVQCTATPRALDSAGIVYRVVDLAGDPVALEHVKESGFLQAPVVEGAGDP